MLRFGSDVRALRAWPIKGREPPQPRAPRRSDRFSGRGVEPPLEELMSDPVTAAIMAYDGVNPTALRSLVARIRAELLARPSVRADRGLE